ncbi:MAG: PASTA domain-containing protein [Gemmatimonadota bacterium]|nr:MAG: PASTA domain-containing protein [Gemmatimonadota bacterium]
MRQDSSGEHSVGTPALAERPGAESWLSSPLNVAGVAAAISVAGILIGYVLVVLFVFPSQHTGPDLKRVPDLVGKTREDGRALAERAGLMLDELGGLEHKQPAGTIVAQEPLASQMAEPGTAIRVIVSLGAGQHPLPAVVGMHHEQAEIALAQAGFEIEVTWVDADVDVGQVVGTRPAPGANLALGDSVRILVSSGSRVVQVPDLLERTLVEARATLERLGLEVGDIDEDSATAAAPGTVLNQSPAAGSRVARGTRVLLTVAIRS